MPKIRSLYPLHALPHVNAKAPKRLAGLVIMALACGVLVKPGLSSATDQCAELFERQSMPAGARTIVAERALSVNQMRYCIHAYETDWEPTEVLTHYRKQWTSWGRAHSDFDLHKPNPNTLMAMMGAHHYRVHVIAEDKLTAVSLSRIQQPRGDQASAATGKGLSIPGFRVFYEQSNQAGHSLGLISDKSQPAAVKQVLTHFQQQGWQVESKQLLGGHAATQEPTAHASLSLDQRRLEVTVQSHLGQSQVLLEFITSSHRNER